MTKTLFYRGLLLLMLCGALSAQFSQRSGISGLVTDASGAVIPGASITATDLDRNQTMKAESNEVGLYSFTNLTPGRYQVTVERTGFRKAVSGVIVLTAQETARLDVPLELGAVADTVDVRAEAPLLQTEQTEIGQRINRNYIENLPIKSRNITSVVATSPNISTIPKSNTGSTFAVGGNDVVAGMDYRVGGGGLNGFYLNGVNVNDTYNIGFQYSPGLDSIGEVKVNVTGFAAENGRDISTVLISTRAGTTQFHGGVFDNFQNSGLNAWNPMDKALARPGQKKALLQRNQFGANLGGPAVIPKLFNGRDRLFFFVNYEGKRERQGGSNNFSRVPTDAERQGDFSDLLRRFPGDPNYILYDPYSTVVLPNGNTVRTPIPNNDIRNIGKVDPRAQDMLNLYPRPNGYRDPTNAGNLNNYSFFRANAPRSWRVDSRVDFRATNSDNLFFTYSQSSSHDDISGGLFPDFPNNVVDHSRAITFNYARVISPQIANEFVFGIARPDMNFRDDKGYAYLNDPNSLKNKYFQNINSGENFGVFTLRIANLNEIGANRVQFFAPTWQFSDNLSWVRGKHSVKFGFNFLQKNQTTQSFSPLITFTKQYTRSGSAAGSRGGEGMADFFFGIPTTMQQAYNYSGGSPDLNVNLPYWGLFVDDKIQLTQKLTLSLGLRYDLALPIYSPSEFGMAFMDFDYPGWQLKIPGRADGVGLHNTPADKNNFAPRVSVAYRMKSDLVARVSYGIFYNAHDYASLVDAAVNAVPRDNDLYNNARFNVQDDVPYFKFSDILPQQRNLALGTYPVSTGPGAGWYAGPKAVTYYDAQSGTTPYLMKYMAQIQKGLGADSMVSVYYLGDRGIKLPYYDNLNIPGYRTGWASQTAFDAARPNHNGRFTDVRVFRHGLNSFYNAGTVQFERRMSRGLQVSSSYTFSKAVSDQDGIVQNFSPRLDWNRSLGRGEADFSHPHRFVATVVYQMPSGGNLPSFAKAVLGGWQVSSITTFESGNSLPVTNAATSARDFEPDRPNVSGNPNLPHGERSFYRYFDTSVFSAPPQDVKGNAGYNIIRGPGQNNWDISLAKTFRPKEKFSAQFRADLFNAFNHAQWGAVNTTYDTRSGNTFGRVTAAREPRIVQMLLRLQF